MEKFRIITTQNIRGEARTLLEEHCEIIDIPMEEKERIYNHLENCEGLLTSGAVSIDSRLLDRAPNLRIVSNSAVGYNNFHTELMKARGVLGTNTPYVLDDSVADTALALMLATARRVCELDAWTKTGCWQASVTPEHFGIEVSGKTLGIVGMGRIGETLAKRAALGMDMDILYYTRSRKTEAEEKYGAKHVTLHELMKKSDFIVILTPLTPATTGLIGEQELALMKKTGILINIARGPVVVEAALVRALEEKNIYGAGLDVYDQEPIDPEHPLLKMKNVVTLPHIGSATLETRDKMALCAVRNLIEGLSGKVPAATVPELK